MPTNSAGYTKNSRILATYFRLIEDTEPSELFDECIAYFEEIDEYNDILTKKVSGKPFHHYTIEGLIEYLHLSSKGELSAIMDKSPLLGKIIDWALLKIERQLAERMINPNAKNAGGIANYLKANYSTYFGDSFQGVRRIASKQIEGKRFTPEIVEAKVIKQIESHERKQEKEDAKTSKEIDVVITSSQEKDIPNG